MLLAWFWAGRNLRRARGPTSRFGNCGGSAAFPSRFPAARAGRVGPPAPGGAAAAAPAQPTDPARRRALQHSRVLLRLSIASVRLFEGVFFVTIGRVDRRGRVRRTMTRHGHEERLLRHGHEEQHGHEVRRTMTKKTRARGAAPANRRVRFGEAGQTDRRRRARSGPPGPGPGRSMGPGSSMVSRRSGPIDRARSPRCQPWIATSLAEMLLFISKPESTADRSGAVPAMSAPPRRRAESGAAQGRWVRVGGLRGPMIRTARRVARPGSGPGELLAPAPGELLAPGRCDAKIYMATGAAMPRFA